MSDEPDSIEIVNEYAKVSISKKDGKSGLYLEIRSPNLDHSIRLTPADLLRLTQQNKDLFSRLLSTPYGPIDPEEAYLEEL